MWKQSRELQEVPRLKCPKCGHRDNFMSNWHDVEQEYAKLDDEPQWKPLPIGFIVAVDGFVYWRSKRFIRRMPLEIYRARGKLSKPIGYYDAGPHSHKFNMTRRYTE